MPRDLTLRCRCGRLQLTATDVHVGVANRLACHCNGCRTWAARMGHEEILDPDGGIERFQVDPASLTFRAGRELLGCSQQTRRGAYRWYARCCGSPIALTLAGSRVPFVGLDVARVDTSDLPVGLTPVLGPIRARVNHRFPRAERRHRRADFRSLLAMLAHLIPLTFTWWRQGAQRRSPFFDAATGAPVEEVERLHQSRPLSAPSDPPLPPSRPTPS